MTFFRCETCKCCEEGCKYLKPGCLKATFSGFDAETSACVECDKFDGYSLVLRRDELKKVTATATAIRPDGVVTSEGCANAEFTVTLHQNWLGTYTVEYVSVDDGGSCYLDCTELSLTIDGGWIGCDRPVFSLDIGRDTPRLNAAVGGGSGAALSVSMSSPSGSPGEETWSVESVAVNAAGSGYTDGQAVTFTVQDGAEVAPAAATIRVKRQEPSLNAQVGGEYSYSYGSVTLSETTDANGRPAWQVTGAEIYAYPLPEVGDSVTFMTGGVTLSPASATVSSVDGGVVSVTITDGGLYYQTDGSIESVVVTEGGEYFRGGAIKSVSIIDGGRIYPNDPCRYISAFCGDCPRTDATRARKATVTFGESGNVTFRLRRMEFFGGFTGWAEADLELDASITGWDGTFPIEFPPESFTNYSACTTAGTITVEEVSCESEYTTIGDCQPLPEQIEVAVSNYNLLLWTSEPPAGTCADNSERTMTNWHCHECATGTDGTCNARIVASSIYDFTSAQGNVENDTYIFDLVSPAYVRPATSQDDPYNCAIVYRGHIDLGPLSRLGAGALSIDCNRSAVQAEIVISPVPCQPTVFIAPPAPPPPLPSGLCPATTGCQTATAVVSSVAAGAVTGIEIVNGGTCYAWRTYTAREPAAEEVTLALPYAAGTGAALTPVWTQDGTGNEATFHVSDVTVDDGGTGYNDGDEVLATVHPGENGVLVCSGAFFVGTAVTAKEEPEAEIVPAVGSGAVLSIVWSAITPTESQPLCWQGWEVASVTVTDGGTGYVGGGSYTLNLGDKTVSVSSPYLRIVTDAPDAEVSASVSSGSDASLVASLTLVDFEGFRYWYVSGVTVSAAGSGYTQDEPVAFTAVTGEITDPPSARINVDEDGAITGIVVDYGGQIESNIGPIQSVDVVYGGVLHKKTGVIACVDISEGGSYVSADPTGVDSAQPDIQIRSQCHSVDAEVEAEFDLDPDSPSFGAITAINVTDGGEGYKDIAVAWKLTVNSPLGGHRTPGDMCFSAFGTQGGGGCYPSPDMTAKSTAHGCPDVSGWFVAPSTRTTTGCPSELLTRTYKMFLGIGIFPYARDCSSGAECLHGPMLGTPTTPGGTYWMLIDAGDGEFECSINPA